MDSAVAYLARLKAAMTRVDAELWPQAELSQDLESLMVRLNQIPDRVQEWKKSSARCGADVAQSLVRVHCKDVNEDKLAELKDAQIDMFSVVIIGNSQTYVKNARIITPRGYSL